MTGPLIKRLSLREAQAPLLAEALRRWFDACDRRGQVQAGLLRGPAFLDFAAHSTIRFTNDGDPDNFVTVHQGDSYHANKGQVCLFFKDIPDSAYRNIVRSHHAQAVLEGQPLLYRIESSFRDDLLYYDRLILPFHAEDGSGRIEMLFSLFQRHWFMGSDGRLVYGESENRYHPLGSGGAVGLLSLDRSGVIRLSNRAAQDVLDQGHFLQDAQGIFQAIHPADHCRLRYLLQAVFTATRPFPSRVISVHHPSGRTQLMLSISPAAISDCRPGAKATKGREAEEESPEPKGALVMVRPWREAAPFLADPVRSPCPSV